MSIPERVVTQARKRFTADLLNRPSLSGRFQPSSNRLAAHGLATGTRQIPMITRGMDWNAVSEVTLPFTMRQFDALLAGQPFPNFHAEMNAALAALPETPDETLK
jgi:hypothetical protein